MKHLKNTAKGIGVIEVLIGATIITVGILALIQSFSIYLKYALANDKNVQASFVSEEALEVMGFLRDGSWNVNIKNLSTTTPYYPYWNSTSKNWSATTTPQYVDATFIRQIQLSDVQRDANGKLVMSGGIYDPNTKYVTVTTQYFQGKATSTLIMNTYLTNLYNN